MDVAPLLRRGESEKVEFKESFGQAAIETICAFANAAGGTLLIGVTDKGIPRGVQSGPAILKDWANRIAQGTGVHPSIVTRREKGKPVVVIQVQESKMKPVLFHGRAYKRVGSTTRQMSPEGLARVVLDGMGVTWDELPETRARLKDISAAKVREFVRLANETGRRPIPGRTPVAEVLEKLKLVKDGHPVRAAVLLFGKDPKGFYSQAYIKAGRFRSDTLIVDDREIEGTVFEQIDSAMNYFRERLMTRFEKTEYPRRKTIWEYPLKALREAVINAVCHRDYIGTGAVQIRIYDDETWIWNPGSLPKGWSVEMLKEPHPSKPRNRRIAEILFYAGIIEAWGSGTRDMIRRALDHGLLEPVFDQELDFKVVFKKSAKVIAPHDTTHVTTHDTTHVTTHVVKLLRAAGKPRSRTELQKILGLRNRRYFQKVYLAPLVEAGWLAMTLPDKPHSRRQRYRTTSAGAKRLETEE
ncbi:MAG: ATP-binding protein [Elusimicrobiota bacterium]